MCWLPALLLVLLALLPTAADRAFADTDAPCGLACPGPFPGEPGGDEPNARPYIQKDAPQAEPGFGDCQGGLPGVLSETPARRIVALYGAFSDILIDMDLGDRLAARTLADTRPELAHLPVIGTHMRPNAELIASLKPDLVLQFQGRGEAEDQAQHLRALGLRVEVLEGSSFEDLWNIIAELGRLTGEPGRAARLTAQLQGRLEAVSERRHGKPRPRVFFEIRSPNLLAAGEDSMASAVIRAAGAKNAVALPERVARLSEEELIRLDPDVYLVQRGPMNPSPAPPADRPHYRTLRAIKAGAMLEVDERAFSRPAPDAVDAVEQLAAYLDTLDTLNDIPASLPDGNNP